MSEAAKAAKPTKTRAPKATSEVVSFRLPIKEYEALATEARLGKRLISDVARDKYRHGETFSSLVGELREQRDSVEALRSDLSEQLAQGLALISAHVRMAMADDAMRGAIEAGIEAGIARLMDKIYNEGAKPSDKRAAERAGGRA